ncbi:MAG: hydrogen gas-evolving membrane-bound hydrogenase subunit E, partial [Planctomycetota bacterium]
TFANGVPWVWDLHFNLPLFMSITAILLGLALGYAPIMRNAIGDVHDRIYPALYWLAVSGGGIAFRLIQTGNFRHYLLLLLVALIFGMSGFIILDWDRLHVPDVNPFEFIPGLLIGIVICASAVFMPIMQQRVVRVLLLGACGFSVVGMYLLYEAPDLALTQVMFELVSVILFVLALRMLPKPDRKPHPNRPMRLVLAASVGIFLGYLTLVAAETPTRPDREMWEGRMAQAGPFTENARIDDSDLRTLGWFFARHSFEGTALTEDRGGGGANIVNVVLVDFRGFDTLGEITVLTIAALGVWSLLPGRRARSLQGHGRQDPQDVKEDDN